MIIGTRFLQHDTAQLDAGQSILGALLSRGAARLGLLLAMAFFSVAVRAQVVDQIEILPDANGEKEVVLHFYPDVTLDRVNPEREGRILRIYFRILGNMSPLNGFPRESFSGQRAAGIPGFAVTFPEPDSSLAVSFNSSVVFRVRQIRGPRTISVFIRMTSSGGEQGNLMDKSGAAGRSASATIAPVPVQAVEPKVVAGIPDMVAPPVAASRSPAGLMAPVAPATDVFPVKKSATSAPGPVPRAQAPVAAYEPKAVPGLPDIVLAGESVPELKSSTPSSALDRQAPTSEIHVASPRSLAVYEPKSVPGIPDVIQPTEPVADRMAGDPSKTKPMIEAAISPHAQGPPTAAAVPPAPVVAVPAPAAVVRAPEAVVPTPVAAGSGPIAVAGVPVPVAAVPVPLDVVPASATIAVAPAPVVAAPVLVVAAPVPIAAVSDPVAVAPAATASQPVDDFAPVPLAQVEAVSKELVDKARQALAGNDAASAVKHLNHLLNLPTNASSREAQELMGLAREKSNELAKAKSEYELFLKLYPVGTDTERVRARLAQLPAIIAQQTPTFPGGPAGQAGDSGWIITGGISQNQYRGNSHIEILTPPPPGMVIANQQTLSLTDQNALITNVDIMARLRSGSTDTRIVFRDSLTQNYLANQNNQERLSAAYFEQSDQKAGYQYRVGRQSGTFGSIGMFDGAFGAYQITPDYRISATTGEVAQYSTSLIRRTFWGTGIEKKAMPELLGGTLYFVQQMADSYVDRQGVGLELRYFDNKKSAFSTIDYDLAFHSMNLIMLQGNYRLDGGTSFNFITDHRKSPMLQLTSALPAATSPEPLFVQANNITQALLNTGVGLSELRQWASDVTAKSHMTSFGITHPLTPKWQIGADMGKTSMSSIPGAGSVPMQAGSGFTTTMNYQLIGSGIVMDGDTIVMNSSSIHAPTYTGRNVGVNLGASWFDYKLRADLGWRYYQQWDTFTIATQNRYSPTLRLSYRLLKDVSLEAETGMEKGSQLDSSGGTTDSLRKYFYMGYRWNWN